MSVRLRVLIVEDSEDDALLLVRELRRGGYAPQFERVDTPETMRAALTRGPWDIVITDHNMPHFDSAAALELVKRSGADIPVIIVSGSIGEEIAVAAMKAGAHDYIMKDNLARLVPAVDRELRELAERRARRAAEETIRHLAYHDPLTGLLNRREFERRLVQALATAKKYDHSHALLYLDLDQFKIINDTCGHVAGDKLLKQLAVVLQPLFRDSDTLARLGGDEFGVLLERCPMERARQIAEDLRRAITDFRFVWQGKTFSLGVSIGLVDVTAKSTNLDDLLSAADIACYAAKDRGRNRIHVYTESDTQLAQRHGEMQWVARINQALEEDRFLLHRQAIVSLSRRGTLAGYEFLIRLRESDGRIVLPGAFIPAAERYGLMPALDRWVVDAALVHLAETLRRGRIAHNERLTFFVNLSGTSLNEEGFARFIHEQCRRHGVPAQMLAFEITETAAIADLDTATHFINEIRRQGCRLALDDFGSGLSSFSYLKTLKVDYLKIDGGFVRDMLKDRMNRAIVEAINRIGHAAGIQTIAEHAETGAVLAELQAIGVDYAQGHAVESPQGLDSDEKNAAGGLHL